MGVQFGNLPIGKEFFDSFCDGFFVKTGTKLANQSDGHGVIVDRTAEWFRLDYEVEVSQ